MANTFTSTGLYPQEWASTLQKRLNHPLNWQEVCDVRYTNTRVLNMPYIANSAPADASGTRGTAFSFTDFTLTNEALTVSTYRDVAVYIDRADLAQLGFNLQMNMADRMGNILNERLEAALLAQHADWTNIGDTGGGVIGLSANTITVSASNIDDIIRNVKTQIRVANGWSEATANGIFIIWRPADFELLEAYVQANGFQTADNALKNGTESGFTYLGVEHRFSNDFTAGHVFAGVKKKYVIGIIQETWGQLEVIQNPAGSTGNVLSGVGLHARADYGFLGPSISLPILYDVNVA